MALKIDVTNSIIATTTEEFPDRSEDEVADHFGVLEFVEEGKKWKS